MYDIQKDVENVARAIALEIEDIADVPNGENCLSFIYTNNIARAALNASSAVKELKELQERYDALVEDIPDTTLLLDFVADRLVYVYGESENVDFVQGLRKLRNKLTD